MNATKRARRADALEAGWKSRRKMCERAADLEDIAVNLMRIVRDRGCGCNEVLCDEAGECKAIGRCQLAERLKLLNLWDGGTRIR